MKFRLHSTTVLLCDGSFQMFSDFELEAHLECAYDRVELFDGDDATAPLIGRYCGSTRPRPDTVVAQSNRLYMTFSSDASVQRRGFSAVHATGRSAVQGGPKKTDTQFYFGDNFGNSAPILTILSLLQAEIYGA